MQVTYSLATLLIVSRALGLPQADDRPPSLQPAMPPPTGRLRLRQEHMQLQPPPSPPGQEQAGADAAATAAPAAPQAQDAPLARAARVADLEEAASARKNRLARLHAMVQALPLPCVSTLSSWLRHCLSLRFPLSSWLRHCLSCVSTAIVAETLPFLAFPLPSWLRHCLSLRGGRCRPLKRNCTRRRRTRFRRWPRPGCPMCSGC